jgi:N-hydroxyarylamine O-acetyltransferase
LAADLIISPFTDDLGEPAANAGRRPRVDFAAYAERIGFQGKATSTFATLAGLHLAHATTVPFENADILLGRGISLDLAHLERKIVAQRRGGYCFEQNTLFAAVLEDLGFGVTGLAARVRPPGRVGMLGRTHMTLRVVPSDSGGVAYLADVGFGRGGLLLPVPIEPAGPVEQFGRVCEIVPGSPERELRLTEHGVTTVLYGFTTEPFFLADYQVANHHTSTSPNSVFARELVLGRQRVDGRVSLRGGRLTEERDGVSTELSLSSAAELGAALAERFALVLPEADVARLWSVVESARDGRARAADRL